MGSSDGSRGKSSKHQGQGLEPFLLSSHQPCELMDTEPSPGPDCRFKVLRHLRTTGPVDPRPWLGSSQNLSAMGGC